MEKKCPYIKRDDMAQMLIEGVLEKNSSPQYAEYIRMLVYSVPSADVVPVRHGRLVDAGISASGHRLTMCTICKRKMREGIEIGIVSRYCPNCGVRLDEGEEK